MTIRAALPVVTIMVILIAGGCTFSRTILSGSNVVPDRISAPSGDQLHIFFAKLNGTDLDLVAVNRPVTSGNRLQQAVSQLLQGPTAPEVQAGLGTEIPRGTILLGIKGQGNQVELNLSRRFANGGGIDSLQTRIEQLRRTVLEAAGKQKVYLNVEGERLTQTTGEGLEIPQPLN